jgi:hypothetical protein
MNVRSTSKNDHSSKESSRSDNFRIDNYLHQFILGFSNNEKLKNKSSNKVL